MSLPIFISGEPRREYLFSWVVQRSTFANAFILRDKDAVGTQAWQSLLFNPLTCMYISQLAESVSIPPEEFNLSETQFGSVQLQLPEGIKISPLKVVYLEDEGGLVSVFHKAWMQRIAPDKKGHGSGYGMSYTELMHVVGMGIYMPTTKIWTGDQKTTVTRASTGSSLVNGIINNLSTVLQIPDVPLAADVYPCIFPVNVSVTEGNKAGNNISKTTVTYARVPYAYNTTDRSALSEELRSDGYVAPSWKPVVYYNMNRKAIAETKAPQETIDAEIAARSLF